MVLGSSPESGVVDLADLATIAALWGLSEQLTGLSFDR
jgi:hypothetical protein